MNKFLLRLILLISIAGCAKSGDGSGSASSVSGADYSGNYRVVGTECYTANGVLTAAATLAASSPTINITISGNSLSETDAATACSITTTARVEFTLQGANYGSLAISGQKSTTSTGLACSQTITLTYLSGGTITPGSYSSTTANNSTPADVNTSFVRNPNTGALGIPTVFQVSGHPSDVCLFVLSKI